MTTAVSQVAGRQYLIGCPAYCAEALCGHVVVLVVGRATRKLAHLIVRPVHSTDSRLVPAAMAHPEGDAVRLHCTGAQFKCLQHSVDIHPLSLDPGESARGRHGTTPASPYFGLGPSGPNLGLAATEPVLMPQVDYDDHVPPGEVRVYPGDHVHATDGPVGRVRGVVTAADDTVTHILLDEGHLWKRKRVAIPMEMVDTVDDDGLWVRLAGHHIKELPPVEVVAQS